MTTPSPPGDLSSYLDLQREHVEKGIERAVTHWERRLAPDVAAAIRHGVTSGGKRLRPILCVAAFEACGGEVDARVYDLGASLEMIHAYSLMHDDLPCMDDGALRRGRATTHVVYGEDVTVRAGAAMIPAAALQALRASRALGCGEERARRVAATLMQAAGAGGMVGGQWLDLLGEGRALEADELDDLHRRKTGALLTASLVIGGLSAGASAPVEQAVREYGRAIGLAFQIADDILDIEGEEALRGKRGGGDATRGKATYPALVGLDKAKGEAQRLVQEALDAIASFSRQADPLREIARFIVSRKA
ncbi:MAG: polyprenyl synthetase family protein [candidate division NC10 bacterium]|nr:polyprenyl synthetase family protein [candidate division NC10 bacterium]